MKKTFLSLLFVACAHAGMAQCTPDASYTISGIYPTALPDAPADQPYSQTLTVVSGATVPGIGIPLTSYEVTGITGMPAGFTYECVPSDCIFLPNSSGCILVSGNPTQTDVGVYPVVVSLLINGSFAFDLTDYTINVTGEPILCEAGTISSELFQNICPSNPGQFDAIDVSIPTDGVYSLLLEIGPDGSGGTDGDFTLNIVTLPYTLNADLNGVLSFNNLPPLSGTWYITGYVSTDPNDINNTICSFTSDYIEAIFWNSGDPICLETAVENVASPSFTSFPNPSNGLFNVSMPLGTYSLEVFSPMGQLVYSKTLQGSTTHQIDLGTVAKGVYTLRLRNADGMQHQRIIVQ